MQTQTSQGPWWAALTVWAVVNAVNVLQSAGFLSRIPTGSMAINSLLGYVMIALAVPAASPSLLSCALKQVGSSGSVLQFTSPSSR